MAGISSTGTLGTQRSLIAETKMVPLSSLRPHSRNPNNGDTEAIMESLRLRGQYVPIVWNCRKGAASEGCIVKGNHTYAAALELGWTHIEASAIDVSDDDALAILVGDNRLSDLHRPDEGLLAALLSELPSIEGTGYDQQELDDLLARVAGNEVPLFGPAGIEEQGRLDQKAAVRCPECGHEFHPA